VDRDDRWRDHRFPAGVGGDIVVATQGSHAFRLEAATGRELCSVDVGGATARSVANAIRALDVATGAERWTIAVRGSPTMPVVIDGRVIVGTDLGKAVQFGEP
jgi:hypothetical protein